MCENKWKNWFDVGIAGRTKDLLCIFNVECTITMMSSSGMCWRDVDGRSCSHIYSTHICMIGQIFKALLVFMYSLWSNNTILWWAQLPLCNRCCAVHVQCRLNLYYKHASLCSEDGHYFSTQLVLWRSVIPTQRCHME